MVELSIAIASACLPTMRPLFGRRTGKVISSPTQGGELRESDSDPSLKLQQSNSTVSQPKRLANVDSRGYSQGNQGREVSPSEKV